MLARLLAPLSSLSVLDLGHHLHWSGSSLAPLLALPSLCSLTLANCSQLGSLDDAVPLLSRLTALQLGHCHWGDGLSSLRDLTPLSACSNLQLLKLPECRKAARTSSGILPNLIQLTHVEMHLKATFPTSLCSRLVSLQLWACEQVVSLPPLPQLGHLTTLSLHELYRLTGLTPLSSLTQLQELMLDSLGEVGCLAPLSHLTRLAVLDLTWEDKIGEGLDLGPLVKLPLLRELCVDALNPEGRDVLGACALLEHLAGLPGLLRLTLPLGSDTEAAQLAKLTALETLKVVNTSGCTGAVLHALSGCLPRLVSLRLYHVHNYSGSCLAAITSFDSLRSLELECCSELSDVEMEELRVHSGRLTSLHLHYCSGFSQRAVEALARAGHTFGFEFDFESGDLVEDKVADDDQQVGRWGPLDDRQVGANTH